MFPRDKLIAQNHRQKETLGPERVHSSAGHIHELQGSTQIPGVHLSFGRKSFERFAPNPPPQLLPTSLVPRVLLSRKPQETAHGTEVS